MGRAMGKLESILYQPMHCYLNFKNILATTFNFQTPVYFNKN